MSLDDKCPSCGTPATYELGENNWACKCTYEAETAVTLCECDCMKSGEIRERERIIKLLEGQECFNDRCYCTFYSAPDRHCSFVAELIALIKGEQK